MVLLQRSSRRRARRYDDVFSKLYIPYEKQVFTKLERLRSQNEVSIVINPLLAGGTSLRGKSGPERLALLLRTLDSFGLKRSKHQRDFHKTMLKSCIPYIFRDDMDANIESLEAQFDTAEFVRQCMFITPRRFGKCLGPNVLIRRYNSPVPIFAKDVQVGDLLVGDDARRRIVIDTICGTSVMFRISEVNNSQNSFTCNADHLLVLYRREDGTKITCEAQGLYKTARKFGAQENNGVIIVPDQVQAVRVDDSVYQISIEQLSGESIYCGFQCASLTSVIEDNNELLNKFQMLVIKSAGNQEYLQVLCSMFNTRFFYPSLADGKGVYNDENTLVYPGRFLLADGTITHNTYSVAMFVAAGALSIDAVGTPFIQSIFSTGRRASAMLLELVARFITAVTGETKAGYIQNQETIKMRGDMGSSDIREVHSYPSVVKVRFTFILNEWTQYDIFLVSW